MEDNTNLSDVSEELDIVDKESDDSQADNEANHYHKSYEHRHSHHRTGHRHRHRHHRSKHSAKKNKFTAIFKKNRSILINILSCTISVVLLVFIAFNADKTAHVHNEPYYVDITQSSIKVETSIYPEKVSLVSDAISCYLDVSNDHTALEVYKSFEGYKGGLNKGYPFTFVYRVTGIPSGVDVQNMTLDISESNIFENSNTYQLDADVDSIDIFNLKTATNYFYRLNVTLSNGCVVGTTGSFETENSPRILNIDGIVNVRDIGGWTTKDGKTIRQGLLYRGSEIDGAVESSYSLTPKGLEQMLTGLGIRFDMDLRSHTDNKNGMNALGNNVVHKYYNAPMYSEVLTDNGADVIKNVFTDLAEPDNYPVYLHCTYGRDRTGTISYLLGALLGMSDEDLKREYELSLFTDSYVNYAEFDTFTERIRSLEGLTTKEKVEGWLLSAGVTEEQIASIREIFLGK